MLVLARLGLDPWDVLHQGLGRRIGVGVGTATIAVSLVVLLAWWPLHQRPGLGTICNTVLVGSVIDLVLALVHPPASMPARIFCLVAGVALSAVATGAYIGAGLGAGPRDGLTLGLAARGHSIRLVRTTIELSALAVGWLLGGSVGVGTLVYALSMGPLTHITIPALAARPRPPGPEVARAPTPDRAGDGL
jgi:uncharacterized membrane protein YczE